MLRLFRGGERLRETAPLAPTLSPQEQLHRDLTRELTPGFRQLPWYYRTERRFVEVSLDGTARVAGTRMQLPGAVSDDTLGLFGDVAAAFRDELAQKPHNQGCTFVPGSERVEFGVRPDPLNVNTTVLDPFSYYLFVDVVNPDGTTSTLSNTVRAHFDADAYVSSDLATRYM